MASVAHELEYLATLAGIKISNSLSDRSADRFGAAIGKVMYHLLGSRRQIAVDNLTRALGGALSGERIDQIARQVFANIGRTLVESSRLQKLGRDRAASMVTGPGRELFDRAMANGRGAILLTAHFGNWELLGAWLASLGYPTDFVVATQHNLKVDRLLQENRRALGVEVISTATSARPVFKALNANHVVALVADQHAPGGSLVLDFFDRPAAWSKGLALFSIRSGCPLIPVLLRRESFDRHILMPGELILPPNSGDEEKDIESMIVKYRGFLEAGIRAYPDQWMWTHRRWKLD